MKHSHLAPLPEIQRYVADIGERPILTPAEERELADEIVRHRREAMRRILDSDCCLAKQLRLLENSPPTPRFLERTFIISPRDHAKKRRTLMLLPGSCEAIRELLRRNQEERTLLYGSRAAPRRRARQRIAQRRAAAFVIIEELAVRHEVALRALAQFAEELEAAAALPEDDLRDWEQAAGETLCEAQERLAQVAEHQERYLRARAELAAANVRLVISVAKKHVSSTLSLSDLVQEGNVGLMSAAEKFEPQRGLKFSTYATYWIRQAIQRAKLNDCRDVRLSVCFQDSLRKVEDAAVAVSHRLGRRASFAEISEAAAVAEEMARGAYDTMRSLGRPLSLDASLGEQESPLSAAIHDTTIEAVDREADHARLCKEISRAMSCLSHSERHVLEQRFGLFGQEQRTLEDVGREMGVSKERIRQIEATAIRKMQDSQPVIRLERYLA